MGVTAPKMTAEAAEQWRQSYRRYRHTKHAEKREFACNRKSKLKRYLRCLGAARNVSSGDELSPAAATSPKPPRVVAAEKASPQGASGGGGGGVSVRLRQAGDSNLAHVPLNQRRLHRHIRELARRRSCDPRAELREQSPGDFAQSTPEATRQREKEATPSSSQPPKDSPV